MNGYTKFSQLTKFQKIITKLILIKHLNLFSRTEKYKKYGIIVIYSSLLGTTV